MEVSKLLEEDLKTVYARSYFNLLITAGWIENRIKKALKPFAITHAQLNVLSILVQNSPEPMPANALKENMLVSNPDVTRLLDRLVKKGYVVREICPENRRKMDISITDSGKDLFYKAHIETKQAVNNFFEDKLTVDEAKELRRILHKVRS